MMKGEKSTILLQNRNNVIVKKMTTVPTTALSENDDLLYIKDEAKWNRSFLMGTVIWHKMY